MVIVFPYGTCAICETGLPKPKYRGRRIICDDAECLRAANRYGAQILNARHARRRREQPAATHKRCPRCAETKPLDERHWYVEARDAQTGHIKRYAGWCRECKKSYQRETNSEARRERKRAEAAVRQERLMADPDYAAQARARNAQRARRWRRSHPDTVREIQRRYRERVKADPARLQREREARRIAYRLRRERETGQFAQRARTEREREEKPLPRLPAAPLGEAVDRHLRQIGVLKDFGEPTGIATEFLTALGISLRTVIAWRSGERKLVQFNVADRVLTRLGLGWWDVWPPDEYPDVAARLGADS